ncbi:hypothetical protein BCS37_06225 [Selenomonas sp. oral taxon 920]|uniref:hypothetical protein n=1 Tax=Selenomonas sp. oral taxon 920 TaxID=1884263 RepID=UPI000840CA68|nr:hypothetical protein [Selenomonas sp. oral taxon 920]AOH48054.1 hypothetical protein BCS37_06225 [Selenomonas sp. oral taxon 920]
MNKLLRYPFLLVIFSLISVSAHVEAIPQYLDNNPNYRLSYAHANYCEYVDLISCTYNDEDETYETCSSGYIAYTMDITGDTSTYQTRTFRFRKNRTQPPQVYENGEWITLQSYSESEGQRYIEQYGYTEYIEHYHLYARSMFNIVYEQISGMPYPSDQKETIQ